jgi:hypothetical protein
MSSDLTTADPDATIAELEADTIGVSGRIRVVIEAIVFEGMTRAQAAEKAGLPIQSARSMLCQPKYLKAMERALQVRRTLERPRNFQRMVELRDQDRHLPVALAAARTLDGLGDRGSVANGAGSVTVNVMSPGWIIQPPAARMQANPLIDLTSEPSASDDEVGDA